MLHKTYYKYNYKIFFTFLFLIISFANLILNRHVFFFKVFNGLMKKNIRNIFNCKLRYTMNIMYVNTD